MVCLQREGALEWEQVERGWGCGGAVRENNSIMVQKIRRLWQDDFYSAVLMTRRQHSKIIGTRESSPALLQGTMRETRASYR